MAWTSNSNVILELLAMGLLAHTCKLTIYLYSLLLFIIVSIFLGKGKSWQDKDSFGEV